MTFSEAEIESKLISMDGGNEIDISHLNSKQFKSLIKFLFESQEKTTCWHADSIKNDILLAKENAFDCYISCAKDWGGSEIEN